MNTAILNRLKNHRGLPCISVIVPVPKTLPERRPLDLQLDNAFSKAKDLVFHKYGKDLATELINKLGTLFKNTENPYNSEGIGFFVSSEISLIVKFPFPVSEKIIVGNSFEIRDVLYMTEMLLDYYVLLINENTLKLFKGNGKNLEEIKDENFPAYFVDDHEYARTSLGSSNGYSLKSTEKDKSIVKEQRLMANLKQTGNQLSKYYLDHIPFIISGGSKDLGYFKKSTALQHNLVGEIQGNYIHESIQKLGELSFEKIKAYLKEEENKALEKLEEALGKKLAVTGIRGVWMAAKEGKGLLLLVEKDFASPGFINPVDSKLYAHPVQQKHEIITDIVDDIMELVLEKKGKVILVENGKLDKYERIALIARY